MNLSDFRNLDTSNVGAWPTGVKYTFAALLIAVICVAGWYFKISDQQAELERVAGQESGLRAEFELKQGRVVNLQAYRDQLAEMDDMFRQMVKQLPSATEMPELLVDISQSALAAGIDTQLFSPGGETAKDFYAEKPITVRMIGDYHQFGDFISRVAALSRVVILEVRDITPEAAATASRGRAAVRRGGAPVTTGAGGALKLEGTIRTFRYLDEAEQAQAAAANAPPARRR
jgi:type IV pilus assembly protein PilO